MDAISCKNGGISEESFWQSIIESVGFFPIGSKTTASTPTSKDQWKHFRGIGIHHENVIDHSLPVPRASADWQKLEFSFLILERQKLCGRTEGSVRSVVDSCDCETDRTGKIRGDSTHSYLTEWGFQYDCLCARMVTLCGQTSAPAAPIQCVYQHF